MKLISNYSVQGFQSHYVSKLNSDNELNLSYILRLHRFDLISVDNVEEFNVFLFF